MTIKSGDNKDLLNPFRDMTPAQTAMLQQVIDADIVVLALRHVQVVRQREPAGAEPAAREREKLRVRLFAEGVVATDRVGDI